MKEESPLAEAERIVDGGRQSDYGPPGEDFAACAKMWTAYLDRRGLLNDGMALDAEDIPWMMVLLKVNRQAHVRKRDNGVDVCGYVQCAWMTGRAVPADEDPLAAYNGRKLEEQAYRKDAEKTIAESGAAHVCATCDYRGWNANLLPCIYCYRTSAHPNWTPKKGGA